MNLTGRSYAVAIAIALLGILGEWGPSWLEGAWRYLAAAYLLLLLHEGILARRPQFTLTRLLPLNVGLGVHAEGSLLLRNDTDRAITVHMLDEAPAVVEAPLEILSWEVAAHATATKPFGFTPTQLGPALWRRVHTRVRGVHGLAWWSRRVEVDSATQVVPDRLHGNERKRISSADAGELSRKRSGAGYELLGMRPYQAGDPVRSIDWKATARSNTAVVRLLTREERLELVILIDAGVASGLRAGELTRLGHYTNVAARLAEKAMMNGDRVHVVVFADHVLAVESNLRGQGGVVRLRALLKKLTPARVSSNPLPAVLRVRELAKQRSLIVVLTDLDEGDGAEALARATSLLRPKHMPMIAGIADRTIMELLHQRAARWLHPYETLAAHETAENWRRTRIRLERMGATAFMALPEELDSRVQDGYERLRARGSV